MNSTRWQELFSALEGIRLQLDFRRKDLRIDDDPPWDGDIYHVFGLDQFIEWMEIRPRIAAAHEVCPGQCYSSKTAPGLTAALRTALQFFVSDPSAAMRREVGRQSVAQDPDTEVTPPNAPTSANGGHETRRLEWAADAAVPCSPCSGVLTGITVSVNIRNHAPSVGGVFSILRISLRN